MISSRDTCDISVVIPTWNRNHLLRQTLDSLLRQQSLDGVRLQVIVIDDCSAAPPRELLAEYGAEVEAVFLERNAGPIPARNVGIGRARGTYLKFLDSDDILVDGVLAREFAAAETEPADMVLTGWGTVSMDEQGNHVAGTERTYPVPRMEPLYDAILRGRSVPISAALYRRSYLGELVWDTAVTKLSDWDWFCQAALRGGRIVSLDEVSFWWRQHHGERETKRPRLSTSHNFYRILGKVEARLRAAGELTEPRAKRLAQYYYKELRCLCLFDRPMFYAMLEKIHALDPHFYPVSEERQPVMRLLARLIGTKYALLLHTALKQALKPERVRP